MCSVWLSCFLFHKLLIPLHCFKSWEIWLIWLVFIVFARILLFRYFCRKFALFLFFLNKFFQIYKIYVEGRGLNSTTRFSNTTLKRNVSYSMQLKVKSNSGLKTNCFLYSFSFCPILISYQFFNLTKITNQCLLKV